LAVDLMLNVLQSIYYLDRNSLHVSVHQCAPNLVSFTFFFLSLSCFTSKFCC